MQDNTEKTIEELRIEAEKAELQARINDANYSLKTNKERIKKTSTLKGLAIVNLCILPAFFTFWILPIVQSILTLIHKGRSENNGLKIVAGILSLITIIIGPILTIIYANREISG